MLLSEKKDIYMINFSETPTTFTQFGGGRGVSHVVIYIYHPLLWKPTILGGMACN